MHYSIKMKKMIPKPNPTKLIAIFAILLISLILTVLTINDSKSRLLWADIKLNSAWSFSPALKSLAIAIKKSHKGLIWRYKIPQLNNFCKLYEEFRSSSLDLEKVFNFNFEVFRDFSTKILTAWNSHNNDYRLFNLHALNSASSLSCTSHQVRNNDSRVFPHHSDKLWISMSIRVWGQHNEGLNSVVITITGGHNC